MKFRLVLILLVFTSEVLCAQMLREKFIFDFETSATLPKFKTFQTDYEISQNPAESDVNSSLLVGRVFKIPDGSIGWSGIVTYTPRKMNLGSGGVLKMKVFATTKKGKVQVKLETEPLAQYEYGVAEITKLNEWEELVFKFKKRSPEINFTKLVIIFSVGTVEKDIYYFDDVQWVEGLTASN